MSAQNTDLVRLLTPRFSTGLATPASANDTTLFLQSVAGLSLSTGVTLNIDETDVNGAPSPNFREEITGVVNPDNNTLVNCKRGLGGTTAQAHNNGASVVQWWDAIMINDFMEAFLAEHGQQGNHVGLNNSGGMSTDTLTASGVGSFGGQLSAGAGLNVSAGPVHLPVASVPAALAQSIPLFAVGNTLSSGLPDLTTSLFKIQCSTTVTSGDGGGFSTINFPVPFPNGIITVIASQGDRTQGSLIATFGYTLNGFNVQYPAPGGVRTNWLALGW